MSPFLWSAVTIAAFHGSGKSHLAIQWLTNFSKCGPTTEKVQRNICTVMPSVPQARDELMRLSAALSSGRVAGPGENAPAHTRGGRGDIGG